MKPRWCVVVLLLFVCPVSRGQTPFATDVPRSLEPERHDPFIPVDRQLQARSAGARVVHRGFVSVQVNVDPRGLNICGDAANEPSIAVDPLDRRRKVIGWRQFDTIRSNFRQAGYAYSHDHGANWAFPAPIEPGVFRSDPVLETDSLGRFYYHSLTSDSGQFLCHLFRSSDGGVTWGEAVYAFGGDKPWMTIDRNGGIGDGNIYTAWSVIGCCGLDISNRSTDGGDTFQNPVPVRQQPVWGQITVGPDGTLYVPGRKGTQGVFDEFVVAVSTTAQDPFEPLSYGFTTEVNLGGGMVFLGDVNPAGIAGQVGIAVDSSTGPTRGNVYLLGSVDPPGDDPLDVHFVRSLDGGATWSAPIRINDDPLDNGAWQWFGTISVAPNGRLDVVWSDTRNDPGGFGSQLFYSASYDGGTSWSPNVEVSPAFDPHLGWPNQNKIGDYYDMVSDETGADVAYSATFNGEQDVYYLRIGGEDCNQNAIPDPVDLSLGLSDDANGNSIPDECEAEFVRADADGGGTVGFEDTLHALDYQFRGGPGPCLDAQDANDDGLIDISDPAYMLSYLFGQGPVPPPPFVECAVDPTPDGFDCATYASCP